MRRRERIGRKSEKEKWSLAVEGRKRKEMKKEGDEKR